MIPTLLVDYGEVISQPQPEESIAAMAKLTELDPEEFLRRYWHHRPPYDRGAPAEAFWSLMVDGDGIDSDRLGELIRLDVESWCLFNTETLELLRDARDRGSALSLFSNAPHDLALVLDRHPALDFFDHRIFSSWIGEVKPDRAAFDAAVQRVGRQPRDILFIDDRLANVEGAIDAGLQAVQFTSPAELRGELARYS